MSVVHANVNKASIQVTNSPQFPSLPTKWKDRFDIRIWNELEAICNSALAEIASHKRKRTCTTILTTTWTIFFILANVLLGVYAGGGEEYCCSYDSYNNCQDWCHEDYNYGAFVSSWCFMDCLAFCCSLSVRVSSIMIFAKNQNWCPKIRLVRRKNEHVPRSLRPSGPCSSF
eukprot:780767_1